MKKLISLLVLIMILPMIFAANLQKLYTVDDVVYQRVAALCSRSGVIGPSTFSPVSARSLEIAMERIDYTSLTVAERNEYDKLYKEISGSHEYLFRDDYFAFDVFAQMNQGLNIANYSDFDYGNTEYSKPAPDHREATLVPYRYEKGFLSLGLAMEFSDYIYMDAMLSLKNRNQLMQESTLGFLATGVIDKNDGILTGLATEWPHRAGASIGNTFFNFTFGRFPHSIGGGFTGNLLVGNNFIYQEVFNLSLLSNHFSYNISVTRFDLQETIGGLYYTDFSKSKFSGNQQYRVIHRFDITALNKIRIALNLGTIYYSTYGFDLRFFYPFVVSHNYWNYSDNQILAPYDEANNILNLEFEWNITRGLDFTAQIAVDQLQLPWEDSAKLPLAFGALMNLEYTMNTEKGQIRLWTEGVYTNPYLYLNTKYTDDTKNRLEYNLDYIVGYNMSYMDDYGYSGYVYGPDNIVLAIGGSYSDSEGRFEAGGNILYKVHGLKGAKHMSHGDESVVIDMEDAIIDGDFKNNVFTPSGGWGTAEHMIKLASYVRFTAYEGKAGKVSIYTALGGNIYFNYNNNKGDCEVQPQALFGLLWQL